MYGCDVPPWISVHMFHSTDSQGPILTLIVRIRSRVEIVGQIVGWEVHFVEKQDALSKHRLEVIEAQHTRIVDSSLVKNGRR